MRLVQEPRRYRSLIQTSSDNSSSEIFMLTIAVDAMGGDFAPSQIVAGALQAAELGIPVVLVGPEDLEGRGNLELIVASEVIEMDDDPAYGVRRKKDSTLVRAAEAVRDGKASAMISAGNTGATMASALLRMGRIKNVNRPAIATTIPVPGGRPTVLLDAGANAEVVAEWLVQFAIMGSVYSHHRYGVENPRVGLLSIGEEPGKGDSLRKEAFELLSNASGINFIGNVEGRDVMSDNVDVVVTDGFTGNVVLKTCEGFFYNLLKRGIKDDYLDRFNFTNYGGSPILGINKPVIIGHGISFCHKLHQQL
jgi:glycerol-3-phosphate acyltransferase PlsX